MNRYYLLTSLLCATLGWSATTSNTYVLNSVDTYSTATKCISYCNTPSGDCSSSTFCSLDGQTGCCTFSNAIIGSNVYAQSNQSLNQSITLIPSIISVDAEKGAPTIGTFVRDIATTIHFASGDVPAILDFNNPYGTVSSASFNTVGNVNFSPDVALQNAFIVLNGCTATLNGNTNWSGNKWYFNTYNRRAADILFETGSYEIDFADEFVLPVQTVFTIAKDAVVSLAGQISGASDLVLVGGGQVNFTGDNNSFLRLIAGDQFSSVVVGVGSAMTAHLSSASQLENVGALTAGPLGVGEVLLQYGSSLVGLASTTVANPIVGRNVTNDVVYIGAESGTLTLSGDKTFSGTVVINNGLTSEVYLQGINKIQNLVLDGGILRLSYLGTHTYGTLSINDALAVLAFDGNIELGTKKNIIALDACISSGGSCIASADNIIDDAGYEVTILSKIIGGDFSTLVKKGIGVLTLDNIANTYSGGTYIQEGALALLGGTSAQVIKTLGTGAITLDEDTHLIARTGGILSNVVQDVSVSTLAHIDVLTGETLTLQNALIISGNIEAGGGLVVNELIDHAGTLALLGTGSVGSLSIVKGELLLSSGATFTPGSALYLTGGSLALGSAAYTLANTALHLEAESNVITDDGYQVAIASIISGDGAFIKKGLGVITLLSDNIYIGGTQIVEGTLAVDALQKINLGSGGITLAGGFLKLTATDTLPPLADVIVYGGGFDITPSTVLTIDGIVSGDGDWNVTGGGELILAANNTFTGNLLIDAATVSIADSLNLGNAASIALASGTLNVSSTLSLARDIAIESGIGTFDISPSSVFTVTGIVSGIENGTLLSNRGKLILSAANSFSGIIEVVDGIIEAAESVNLGQGSKALILRNSTLSIPAAAEEWVLGREFSIDGESIVYAADTVAATFTGLVSTASSTDVLIKQGAGKFSLLPTVVNDYISHLFIEEGGFEANTLAIAATQVDINAGAKLIFSQSSVGSYIGDAIQSIAGQGSVVIDGTSTLILLADNNTYSGGTNLIRGVLQIEKDVLGLSTAPLLASGGTLSTVRSFVTSRPVILADATQTTFATAAQTVLTWAGDISGSGVLIKEKAGKMILSGINTYLGKTYVLGGQLSVLSSIVSSGDPYVGVGALLRGTGSVGDTVDFGTVVGGDPLGTLSIVGDLIVEPQAFLGSYITSSASSFIDVTGFTTIGENTTYLAGFSAETATNTGTVLVLSSGSITGQFSRISTPPIFFLGGSLTYTDTDVSYHYTQRAITALAEAGNPTRVASSLDKVVAWNREHVSCDVVAGGFSCTSNERLPILLASLIDFETTESMTAALEQIQPASLQALTILEEHNLVDVRGALSQRIEEELDTLSCFRMYSSQENGCKKKEHLIATWGYGIGGVLSQSNTENSFGSQIGYIGKMAGIVAGIDAHFYNYLYVGAMGGYTTSNLDWKNSQGKGRIASGYLGIYGAAITKYFYANIAAIGGWSGYRAHRNIDYTGVHKTASNSHSGKELLSHLDLGVNIPIFGFTIRPFDSFDYVVVAQRKFQETGAGEWDLSVEKNDSILLRNELGLQFASCFCFKVAKLSLTPKVSWVRETRIKGGSLTASLNGSHTFFTTSGYFPDRNLISPGISFKVTALEDRLSVDLYYEAELRHGYSAQDYGIGARYSF